MFGPGRRMSRRTARRTARRTTRRQMAWQDQGGYEDEGYDDDEILNVPEKVGGRFSVFSSAGLLPAAVMGLDVRALLLGAATMTRRFLEEGFDRNPVLQYAAVNYLMSEEVGKKTRVLAVWSKKLEGLGLWYDF